MYATNHTHCRVQEHAAPSCGGQYVLHTDGSCDHLKHTGGWGVHIEEPGGFVRELCGGETAATSTRMELLAALRGLQATPVGAEVMLVVDCMHVKSGIERQLLVWQSRNWRGANHKPISDRDLWVLLLAELEQRQVRCEWVPGHSGHAQNTRADRLAREGARSLGELPPVEEAVVKNRSARLRAPQFGRRHRHNPAKDGRCPTGAGV